MPTLAAVPTQGKLDAALADYNASIQLCPWSVDPVINRGVLLEALSRSVQPMQIDELHLRQCAHCSAQQQICVA